MRFQHIKSHLLTGGALAALCGAARADLLITEVVDGTLVGGQPKWVELSNTDAAGTYDLTQYSFGNFNNGGTTLGGGAATVLAGTLDAGDSYIVSYEADNGPGGSMFFSVYGFDPDFYMGGGFVNGDDVLALFLGAAVGDGTNATLVDVYGVIGVDGTGTNWEYEDGYSYRCGDAANNGTFDVADWFVAGLNALEAGCGGSDACETQNLLDMTTPGVHTGCGLGTPFCFGDGSGTACPCGNSGGTGEGCANGSGAGATLAASGSASVGNADLVLSGAQLIPLQPGLYFQGELQINGGNGIIFGDGLRCAGTNVIRLEVVTADSNGDSSTTIDIAAKGGVVAGDTRTYQLWYRDPNTSPCGATFNLSHGLELTWTP